MNTALKIIGIVLGLLLIVAISFNLSFIPGREVHDMGAPAAQDTTQQGKIIEEQKQLFAKAQRHSDEQEKMLEQGEKDQARFGKLLDTWEAQQAQYQKYLDSLPKSQPKGAE